MTPQEKAQELFDKMHGVTDYQAKQSALVAIDEILSLSKIASLRRDDVYMELEYWTEVKQEIEKL